MTKEEILELAEELLCGSYPNSNGIFQAPLNIEKFYRAAFAAGQAEMRERAATAVYGYSAPYHLWGKQVVCAEKAISALPIEGENNANQT